ncbi:hypothetical protein GF336_05990 [Candidatus Woesearchaeota archaeon]|nr:hypothetical protein [Candidatus Woesearchaeota archaeon]
MKKLLKFKLLASLILALFFKIRDSVIIGGFACGLNPSICSFSQFLIQILIWFLVILISIFLIIWGTKTFFNTTVSKYKKKKGKYSKEDKESSKEKKSDSKEKPEKDKKEEVIEI